jgi:hypothetical protein
MTPQQLADVLIGIAQAQANIVSAIEAKLDKSMTHEVRQAIQSMNHAALTQGHTKKPVTLQNLPIKLLEASLAPGSASYREIEKTALTEAQRLLS